MPGIPADAVTVNFDPGRKNDPIREDTSGLRQLSATEVRQFITYDNKLIMGTGMWMEQGEPNIAPTILQLKDGNSDFQVETQFTSRDTAVCLLHVAHWAQPVKYTVPIASTWRTQGLVDLYFRDFTNQSWHFARNISDGSSSGTPQIRSAFNFTDPNTNVSLLFLGESPHGIYSVPHDPEARGGIGKPTLELATDWPPINSVQTGWRVMSFAVMKGKLYATIYNRLYERQNGAHPTWTLVHTDPDVGSSASGFRGLTVVAPETPNPYFFVARESGKPAILKLVPKSGGGFTQTVAYDMRAELSEAWSRLYNGTVQATYGIAAYSGMTWFQPRGNAGPWALWVGIESQVTTRPASMPVIEQNGVYQAANGHFLVWNFEGRGEWHLNFLPPVTSQPMVSCRVGIVNPWGGPRFYIGCFDCNFEPSHNTGCVVSVDQARLIDGEI